MLKLDDPILEEDMNELAGNEELAGLLKGSTVFVTGATGLLGSQVIFALLGMNAVQGAGIRVVGMARSRDKVKKVFGEVEQDEALSFYFGEIEEPVLYEGGVDFVVHGASPTSSKFFVTNPVETILAAIRGTRHMLEFARDKGVRGMVYLSSLEVYGTPEEGREWIKEEDYGYLDPLSVRSSYSEGKRMVECLCVSFAKEYGVPVRMARLSQTFGAGVDYADGRVFAEFARCAVEGRDIVLHTQGNTVRSYCYAKDAVAAILYVLLKGVSGEAYNVTNMDTAVSIREMAELVGGLYPDKPIAVRVEIPEDVAAFGYNPEIGMRLDSTKLQGLGWRATVGLEGMFRRMIESGFLNREDKG